MAGEAPLPVIGLAVCRRRNGVRVVTTRASEPSTAARETPALFHLLELADRLIRLSDVRVSDIDTDEQVERQPGAKLERVTTAADDPLLPL
jgi:hypothetical protein